MCHNYAALRVFVCLGILAYDSGVNGASSPVQRGKYLRARSGR